MGFTEQKPFMKVKFKFILGEKKSITICFGNNVEREKFLHLRVFRVPPTFVDFHFIFVTMSMCEYPYTYFQVQWRQKKGVQESLQQVVVIYQT